MKTVACLECKSVNSADEANCAKCGASLFNAKLEQITAGLREVTSRMQHVEAAHRPGFNSINGFGTTLLDYRPRGDGTWEAVRWVIALSIPLVPLGGYVIQPNRQERLHGRETTSFTVLDRFRVDLQRVLRVYALVIIGLAPVLLGWMNAEWVEDTLGGGGRAFLAMIGCFVWAAYIILVRIKNDGDAYRQPKPATA